MRTIVLAKGEGGRLEAPGVGWIKQEKWTSYDFIGSAEGVGDLVFKRNWTGRKHTIEDSQGRVRGEHEREGWTGSSGPLMWDDVHYEFAVHSGWKGSFVLRRNNEDLATFTLKNFWRDVEVEVLDNAHVPAALMLFGAWMTILRQRDSAASG